MAAMNPNNPAAMANMHQMMNDVRNGIPPPSAEPEEISYESRLNAWIYGYLLEREQWELARSLKNSGLSFAPPLTKSEDDVNGVEGDTKNGGSKRPADLPSAKDAWDESGGSFLLSWFSLFWDLYAAQRKHPEASKGAARLIEQNRMLGQRQGGQGLRMNGLMGMDPNGYPQMMRMNDNLRQKAIQNQQNGMGRGVNPQQMLAMQRMQQQGMRRDPSGMDMNGQRPRTPSSGDHAPSPKRPRMDGAGMNPQMMANGRPNGGMPGQMMAGNAQQANALLMNSGINPANLSEAQFASFQHQNPQVQQKSVDLFHQNFGKGRDGDAMNLGPEYFPGNAAMMRPGGPMGANAAAAAAAANGNNGSNPALQDYQMQLMLLEQQNKKRLLMARQEQQDVPGQPMPAGFAPGMSPQGSRGGPSPGPGAAGRETPKQPGIPGSPMPDGSLRGSPAAMSSFNPMQQDAFAQMNGAGMRPPTSGNPAFAQMTPQQMEQMRQNAQRGMANGTWPQGAQGQAQMGQQGQAQAQQQPAQMGTPQQRTEMPPPQGPPPGAQNGRAGNEEAPPTPQPATKPNPNKGKKEQKPKRANTKKNSATAATPAADGDSGAAPPTPSTPITPSHPNSFANKNENPQTSSAPGSGGANATAGQANAANANSTAAANANGGAPVNGNAPQGDGSNQFGVNAEGAEGDASYMGYNNNDLENQDLLENFDFTQFLDTNAFQFDAPQFDATEMLETPMDNTA